ncbi:rod shape-determining protein RodA [Hahella sp. CCB-MM4]|uniref:rod shape-determining protein RodA n=1 Tax=Hahella sp. (strain CCB-MM4) TaxID=1926491 RepID=UPI000B9A3F96|nr:rod shape-determining protein RodA [Hahella sp. CCB-MM4]OZG71950.1 rod shape-determining protein RodA [Hahella sp. CCB-MM4]
MANGDFLRQLPGAESHFSRRPGLSDIIHIDLPLLGLLLLLIGSGLFVLYSGSGQNLADVKKQGIHFIVALTLMATVAQVDPAVLRRWAPWVFMLGLIGLVAVLLAGADAKGAQRWLKIPGVGVRIQPSEFMKIAVPMMVSWYLADRTLPPSFKHIVGTLIIVAIPAALIIIQPDLGTSILIAASGIFVLLFAGLGLRWIVGFLGAVAALAPIMWFFGMKEYQKQRVLTMLDPEQDPLGAGWNIIQSKTAIGSGGLEGKGWLSGTQSQLDFLPESHTDFIIAVFAEEFGFIGVTVLLTLYLLIILRGLQIAMNGQDTFSRLLAGSLTMTFFVYVFVNMGMVSGILPVVGVPLPLVSYGGTSVLTLMVSFGVLMSIQTHKKMLPR